jgi:hypothetical protein
MVVAATTSSWAISGDLHERLFVVFVFVVNDFIFYMILASAF